MTRSSIKNGMNKKIIIIGSAALVIIIMVFWVFKVISPSVVGEWKIDYYITEDGKIKQDDIGAYYGEQFQIANSAFSVVFDSNGKVTLNLPTYKGTETVSKECEYEVEGNYIFLSGNGDRDRAFEVQDIVKTYIASVQRSIKEIPVIQPKKMDIERYMLPLGDKVYEPIDSRNQFVRGRVYSGWFKSLFAEESFDSYSGEYELARLLNTSPHIVWWH